MEVNLCNGYSCLFLHKHPAEKNHELSWKFMNFDEKRLQYFIKIHEFWMNSAFLGINLQITLKALGGFWDIDVEPKLRWFFTWSRTWHYKSLMGLKWWYTMITLFSKKKCILISSSSPSDPGSLNPTPGHVKFA